MIDGVVIPQMKVDTVYARSEDGIGEWVRMVPSPESSNNESERLRNPVLTAPVFSEEGGFYEEAFWLKIYLSGSNGEAPQANFQKDGRRREIESHIEYFESGEQRLSQQAGLRIHGGTSRRQAKKRFSIYAREEYSGDDYFPCELFENRHTHSFVVKEGFADAFLQTLVVDRDVTIRQARPVIVFLNGEYWYIVYMQEKYGEHYLNDVYGVDKDNVLMIKNWDVGVGEDEDFEIFREFLNYVEEISAEPESAYDKLAPLIDMQNFIEYISLNAYLCNMDLTTINNTLLWRTFEDDGTEYGDCRWRWMMYDMDSIEWSDKNFYGVENLAEVNSFAADNQLGSDRLEEYPVFAALRYNEAFQEQFVLTFMDMVNTNFSPEIVEKKLKEWGEDLSWREAFFEKRADYIVPYMAEEFSLQGTLEEIVLKNSDPNAGTIQVNTCIPDMSKGLWSGKYYTDYPITLTAEAKEGYCFVGWEGDYKSAEETISVQLKEGGTYINAVFEKIEK